MQLLSDANRIKKEPFKPCQYIQQGSALFQWNENTTGDSSSAFSPSKTISRHSPTVRHLRREKQGEDAAAHRIEQETTPGDIDWNQLAHVDDNEERTSASMNSNDESDEELFQTLSRLHNMVRPGEEDNRAIQSDLSSYSLGINQDVSPDFLSSDGRQPSGNELELLNEKQQHRHSRIVSSASPSVIETRERADEEQKENDPQRKNAPSPRNHNDADVRNEKHREKYQPEEKEEKTSTTHFSLTSTVAASSPLPPPSSTLFNTDESLLTVDPDTHSSSSSSSLFGPRFVSSLSNDTTLFTNQLMADDRQTTNTKSNMNNNVTNQTSSFDLFDPFASTIADEMFQTSNTTDGNNFGMLADFLPASPTTTKSQPLANYDFDDLWNQSISHLTSSSTAQAPSSAPTVDPDAFAWDAFLNANHHESSDPFDDPHPVPTSTLTWESLFDQDKELEDPNDLHQYLQWLFTRFDDSSTGDQSQPLGKFIAIQNLESIINEIRMSTKPFEPIPSPPLHTDHNMENPMTRHDLFPIDEVDQKQLPSSFDTDVQLVVERLVSQTLQVALTEMNQARDPLQQFVDQVIAQAIFEIHSEGTQNDSVDHLASILHWHEQTAKAGQQAPAHVEPEKRAEPDPWLTTPEKDLNESDLFSSQSSRPTGTADREDEETTSNLSEYMPPSLITNPYNSTRVASNLMKYTLTAPVMDDSGDDSSMLEDYFASHKVMSLSFVIDHSISYLLRHVFFEEN